MTEALCARPDVHATECDLACRARTSVFADPARIPLANGSVHEVLVEAGLEHLPDAQAVLRAAWRVLRPGDAVEIDCGQGTETRTEKPEGDARGGHPRPKSRSKILAVPPEPWDVQSSASASEGI